MKKNEIRLVCVHGLFKGRSFLERCSERPLFNPEFWTFYSPLVLRKTYTYFICEVIVPMSLFVYVGKPSVVTLRRCVVSEVSSFVRYDSHFSSMLCDHYAFCALRYESDVKEYRCVIAFPCKASEYV